MFISQIWNMKPKVWGPSGQHLVRIFLPAASGKFLKGHTDESSHRAKGSKSEMRQIQSLKNPLMRWGPCDLFTFHQAPPLKGTTSFTQLS